MNNNLIASESLTFKGNKYRITVLSEILIRLEYHPEGKFEDRRTELVKNRQFKQFHFDVKEDEAFLSLETSYFRLEYEKEKPFAGTKVNPDLHLKVHLKNSDKVWYFNHPEARNYGGLSRTLNSKKEKGLYSTDGFVSLDDSKSLILNDDNFYARRTDERVDTYLFMYRRDFGLALNNYFKLTNYPELLPRSAYGVWWSKEKSYTDSDVLSLTNSFKNNGIPVSVFLFSRMWHVKHHNTNSGYSFNYDLISNPQTLIQNLNNNQISVMLELHPFENIHPDEINYELIKKSLNIETNKAIKLNYFDKKHLKVYLDFLITPLYNLNVTSFQLTSLETDNNQVKALNFYHSKFTNNRTLTLSYYDGTVPHLKNIIYAGKNEVSWENLNKMPEYISTAANIGASYIAHDVSGFSGGVEDPELYFRSIQLGTFSPILKFASAESHYYKREPWLWDAKTFGIVKEYLTLRHRLIPYIYTESYKYHKTGIPFIRPLYYNNPEIYDEPLYKNEYYFGSELLIAPITHEKREVMNRVVQRIFLPEGIYYDFKTGKKYMGNNRYVTFFKDEDYPVFARRGSIIPLANINENCINDMSNPKGFEVHIFPGRSNTYKLYEDDGVTNRYKQGDYLITDINYNYQANNFTVIIRPTDGKVSIAPQKRDFKIRFRNTREASDVIVYIGQNRIENFTSGVVDNDFIVEVKDVPVNAQLSINCKGRDIEIDAERIINEDLDSIISDLEINTLLKIKVSEIILSDLDIKDKRIGIKKLRREGLSKIHIAMFIKLLEYIAEL